MLDSKLNDLGFGANATEVKPCYTVSIDDTTGKVTIVIDAPMIKDKVANEKGNKVLNVYHKFNQKLKFSGNLIFNTK